jgi:hypothetical protein
LLHDVRGSQGIGHRLAKPEDKAGTKNIVSMLFAPDARFSMYATKKRKTYELT